MSDCPDLSVLVDVEAATGFRALDVARHVARCDECRALLADLEQVHDAGTSPVFDGVRADAIAAALVRDGRLPGSPPRQRASLAVAVFALSAITAALVVGIGAAAMGGSASPSVLAAAAIVAAVALTWHLGRAPAAAGGG